jgi:hypothetical protein
MVRRTGITVKPVDRYLSFAKVLTELEFPWKFKMSKIDWICKEQVG